MRLHLGDAPMSGQRLQPQVLEAEVEAAGQLDGAHHGVDRQLGRNQLGLGGQERVVEADVVRHQRAALEHRVEIADDVAEGRLALQHLRGEPVDVRGPGSTPGLSRLAKLPLDVAVVAQRQCGDADDAGLTRTETRTSRRRRRPSRHRRGRPACPSDFRRLAHASRMARSPDKARSIAPRVASRLGSSRLPGMVTTRGRMALARGCARALGVAGHRAWRRRDDRRPGRDDPGQLDPGPTRPGPSLRRRDRHERQVDHHPDDGGRAGHPGPVATNAEGANMDAGLVAALAGGRTAELAALEVDEMHVPHVSDAVLAAVIVLLNLSRDQLDRVGEINHIERTLRGGLARHPSGRRRGQLRRRADDVGGLRQPERGVGGRGRRLGQRLGELPALRRDHRARGAHWYSTGTDFRAARPRTGGTTTPTSTARRTVAADDAGAARHGQPRQRHAGRRRGRHARRGSRRRPSRRCPRVDEVAGRYRTVQLGEHTVRMLLAKNPAGWQEALSMVDATPRAW